MDECFSHPVVEVKNRGAIKQTSGEGSDKTGDKWEKEARESVENEKRNWSQKYLKQGKLGQHDRNWLRSMSTWPIWRQTMPQNNASQVGYQSCSNWFGKETEIIHW